MQLGLVHCVQSVIITHSVKFHLCDWADIADVLDWARANDDLVESIAHNARKYAEAYLNNDCVANYMQVGARSNFCM
jgi:hypothetical protein